MNAAWGIVARRGLEMHSTMKEENPDYKLDLPSGAIVVLGLTFIVFLVASSAVSSLSRL